MHDIRHSVVIDAPIEDVWQEVTRLGSVQKAMMDTVLRTVIEPGAPLRYTSRNGSRTFIVGRILEVEAPTHLSHTYGMTMRKDPETIVTWALESQGDRTRVTVHHTGYPADTKGLDKIDATWGGILADLRELLETGNISRGSRLKFAVMRRFLWALPTASRTPADVMATMR